MKISHTQLEQCRTSPAAWLASKAGSGFATFGYNAAVKLAVSKFHKTSSHKSAQEALEGYLKGFKDSDRKQWTRDTLDNYVVWFQSSGLVVADTMPKIALSLGADLSMSGELTRVDLDPKSGRYQAVLLGPAYFKEWHKELRWPLIQVAVSQKYSRDIAEIAVGVQRLDGSDIDVRTFSTLRINKSLAEASELAETIAELGD